MRYEHASQNISYDCAAGNDGFLDLQVETDMEETLTYKERDVMVVSEVRGDYNQSIYSKCTCIRLH